jgi:hypothetical protein
VHRKGMPRKTDANASTVIETQFAPSLSLLSALISNRLHSCHTRPLHVFRALWLCVNLCDIKLILPKRGVAVKPRLSGATRGKRPYRVWWSFPRALATDAAPTLVTVAHEAARDGRPSAPWGRKRGAT